MSRSLRTAVGALVAGAVVLGAAGIATAAPPPYPNDPSSVATLALYDASGNPITHGSITDTPFAAYAQASGAVRAGDTKATLYAYTPVFGLPAGSWSGAAISASTSYPIPGAPAPANASLPTAAVSNLDQTLGSYISGAASAGAYAGFYQLRLKTSAPGLGVAPGWASLDIQVTGSSWDVVNPAPSSTATTTTLTATPVGSAAVGSSVTLNAAITPATAPGTVQFKDGASNIGAAVPVVAGAATTSTSALATGSHSLTAVFTPTNPPANPTQYAGSTSPVVTYGITAAPTSVALAVNTGTGFGLSPVTFTATVTPGGAQGTVSFTDNGNPIGTAPTGSGTSLLTTSALATGSHSVVATFNPANPAAFASSASAASAFSLAASPYTNQGQTYAQNVQAEIDAGTLFLSTPYTPSNPIDLGHLTLDADGSQFSTSQTISGIRVTDTRAGDLPWTVSAAASDLTNGPNSINGQNLGLTGVTPVQTAGNAPAAATVIATQNPTTALVAAGAAGTLGLAGGPHQVLTTAHGAGSIQFDGTLTLHAPTSTPAGTYAGTLTFTVG